MSGISIISMLEEYLGKGTGALQAGDGLATDDGTIIDRKIEATVADFINKTVILYIDESIDLTNARNVNKLNSIKEKGIIVVNGLEELKGGIQ